MKENSSLKNIEEKFYIWYQPLLMYLCVSIFIILSGSQTIHYELELDRGISFDLSVEICKRRTDGIPSSFEGYYWIPNPRIGGSVIDRSVTLVLRRRQLAGGPQRLVIYKPHIGEGHWIKKKLATVDELKGSK